MACRFGFIVTLFLLSPSNVLTALVILTSKPQYSTSPESPTKTWTSALNNGSYAHEKKTVGPEVEVRRKIIELPTVGRFNPNITAAPPKTQSIGKTSHEEGTEDTTVPNTQSAAGYVRFNVTACLEISKARSRNLWEERVEFVFEPPQQKESQSEMEFSGSGSYCPITLTAPRGMYFEMSKRQLANTCQSLYLNLFEIRGFHATTLFSCTFGQNPFLAPSSDDTSDVIQSGLNVVRVHITERLHSSVVTRIFRLTAAPAPDKSQLVVHFNTSTRGFVQTPSLLKDDSYPAGMRSEVQVLVPSSHQIMYTFFHIDLDLPDVVLCELDSVCLSAGFSQTQLGCYCRDTGLETSLLTTSVLLVDFASYRPQSNRTGFKLYFSFHHISALPPRLNNGQWNCSVPHWPEFREHFVHLCNLQQNCAQGEDEQDCPYSSPDCPLGHFMAGGRCFRYLDTGGDMSWSEADRTCRAGGSYLASLNTPREWFDVLRLLRRRRLPVAVKKVYIGLRYAEDALPLIYQDHMVWMDSTVAHYAHVDPAFRLVHNGCGYLSTDRSDFITKTIYSPKTGPDGVFAKLGRCDRRTGAVFLCETDIQKKELPPDVVLAEISGQAVTNVSLLACPSLHWTHEFLACDVSAMCWVQISDDSTYCSGVPLMPLPPFFTCRNELQRVPYTLVCDYRSDCNDDSDEDFCVHQPCSLDWFFCDVNGQCVESSKQCDDVIDCINGRDEQQCSGLHTRKILPQTIPPPAVIHFISRDHSEMSYTVQSIHNVTVTSTGCPETHFRCGDDGYCLPVFVRCNGVNDCPDREDEANCATCTCPGLYRCRNSKICLHPRHVCDGLHHCPQQDDELFCALPCPDVCTCYGLAFYCNAENFSTDGLEEIRLRVRFLDVSGTGITPSGVANFTMMIHLSLSGCSLSVIDKMRFDNLRSLDLSHNLITSLKASHFEHLFNLHDLFLTANPLTSVQTTEFSTSLRSIRNLDLSHTAITSLDLVLSPGSFVNLEILNLSNTGLTSLSGSGFQTVERLTVVDLRGCPILTFSRDIFRGLDLLKKVFADSYKLCCPATLPTGFNLHNCVSPQDEISSCEDLLRSNFYRVFLFLFSLLAMIGNSCSLVYRGVIHKSSRNKAFNLFVWHLCVADFIMGVYLMTIGVADQLFSGTYLWKDVGWRQSMGCRAAGFLSLLSSEVSAFIICLITLDRFLVLRFPLSVLHFTARSGHLALALTWCVGLVLAVVPLLPVTSHWEFYGQTAICIPLPVTRKTFEGRHYSFSVMVVTNFVMFLLIALGQISIYCSVRANSMSHRNASLKHRSQDLTIARRLITIAMSDFLCWFPIGLLGILATRGVLVPGEVNVAMAIFVLPLNSALNPFLYTLNVLRERRERAREKRWRLLMSHAK